MSWVPHCFPTPTSLCETSLADIRVQRELHQVLGDSPGAYAIVVMAEKKKRKGTKGFTTGSPPQISASVISQSKSCSPGPSSKQSSTKLSQPKLATASSASAEQSVQKSSSTKSSRTPAALKRASAGTGKRNSNEKGEKPKGIISKSCSPSRKPRAKADRLHYRFYEPLVLLYTLGSTRGDRSHDNPITWTSSLSIRDARRQFLTDLAYACDYKKGGDTVTAIGLQGTPEANVFWVASNNDPVDKIAPFLKELLTILANNSEDEKTLEEIVSQMCINFASLRIQFYKKYICLAMERATAELDRLGGRKSEY
jgi:hypothetical protein